MHFIFQDKDNIPKRGPFLKSIKSQKKKETNNRSKMVHGRMVQNTHDRTNRPHIAAIWSKNSQPLQNKTSKAGG